MQEPIGTGRSYPPVAQGDMVAEAELPDWFGVSRVWLERSLRPAVLEPERLEVLALPLVCVEAGWALNAAPDREQTNRREKSCRLAAGCDRVGKE
ncbi:MAG: hypothetical protein NW220_01030 [Leptolyngbyaceae cyanobacterium bins.349]|nr:hypothetical protein [Leptolyngbyaceae cyanobacterium bins.349]